MRAIFTAFSIILITGCGGTLTPPQVAQTPTPNPLANVPGAGEPAARFIFHKDNFTDLSDFITNQHTHFQCLGDVLKTYYVNGADYTGSPQAFPASAAFDSLSPTTKPGFIKNISVDITQTYFPNVQTNVVQSDACSYRGGAGAQAPGPCADFDQVQLVTPSPTVAPTPIVLPAPIVAATPSSTPYYGTKYFRVRDDWCTGQGPVLNEGVDPSKTFVGGVSIDLDRSQLGTSEDLLMMVTYQALNQNAQWPGVQGISDSTILEVSLVGTGLGLDLLLGARQPRPWSDHGSSQVPVFHKKIATLQDPFSSLRTEQIYLPLSENQLIDRVRLDRVRGSFLLYQIDLYRLGNRDN